MQKYEKKNEVGEKQKLFLIQMQHQNKSRLLNRYLYAYEIVPIRLTQMNKNANLPFETAHLHFVLFKKLDEIQKEESKCQTK